MKTCARCGCCGEFTRDSRAKDGLNSICKKCQKTKAAAMYAAHRARRRADNEAWKAANPERHNELKRRWDAANPKKVAAKNEAYNLANREKVLAGKSAWQKNNPAKANAARRKRQAAVINRTPPWADHKAIAEVYEKAAALGWHVDHIIPLQGRMVSGLHVHTNLRPLPPLENMKKGNRFSEGTAS